MTRFFVAHIGGEGRTRTFEAARATDLQSAAFDRFATSPAVYVLWKRDVFLIVSVDGAGEGIRTPDLLITNQLLYRPELRQHKRRTLARPVPDAQLLAGPNYGRASDAPGNLLFYPVSGVVPVARGRFRARCLSASNRAIPVATETFRLST